MTARRAPAAHHIAVAGALVASVGMLLAPTGAIGDTFYCGYLFALVPPMAWWVHRTRPPQARAWYALTAGLALFTVGDAAWAFWEHALGQPLEGASAIDGIYLPGYGLVAVALGGLARRPGQRADMGVAIDTSIVGVAGALLAFHGIVVPQLAADGALADRVVSALYPVADVALLAVCVRLVLGADRSLGAFWYLCAGMATMLAADVAFAVETVYSAYSSGGLTDAGWLVAYACLAAAAMHPSATATAAASGTDARPTMSTPRVAMVGIALLVPGAVTMIEQGVGEPVDFWTVIVASVLLVSLVLGRMIGLVRVMERDAADRHATAEAMRHQALHDGLTGLPNRLLFVDRLEQALLRAERSGAHIAVLFCDLDHFKVVNDSLGHDAGDALLVQVAERLRAAVRPDDTVARFGGDEFTVLCEGIRGAEEARTVARRMLAALAEPVEVAGRRLPAGGSIGIALTGYRPDHADSAESLVRDADAAMYRAKERGRNSIVVFDEAIRTRVTNRLSVETALRRAIPRGELIVHYQPVIAVATNRVVGAEALVRWLHPTEGLLGPNRFIPVAEETGLIEEIGTYVLQRAAAEGARWQQMGHDLRVAVNLAPRQLARRGLEALVAGILGDAGLAPSNLCVEITERTMMDDGEASQHALRTLADLGVTISVDDFGTGWSSLAYLQRMPVHELKADRTFVTGIDDDPASRSLVTAIVSLAHGLGLQVVAEGVERPGQLEVLGTLGCDKAQGYWIAMPGPADRIDGLLARERSPLGP